MFEIPGDLGSREPNALSATRSFILGCLGCDLCEEITPAREALLPSARYERRVGVSLVRAAWERRPEGPAYLLSSVTLLYLAGLCAF